ncbi:MAG: CDP-alcohol phosphatidyltransferase family protein [Gemmatimonadota bacterium]
MLKAIRQLLERGLRTGVEPAIAAFTGWRVHPNILSTVGFLITSASGYFFHQHHVRTAGALILLGGVFDLFDGSVARRTGLASPFGAFYDSTLDRLSEIIVYVGLLSLYNDYRLVLGDVGMIYAVMLAMAGSIMISYTRARAEALAIDCTVGLMQRAERVILIGTAALLFGEEGQGIVLKVVIVSLAILTNFTVLQRIWWVYRHTRPVGVAVGDAVPKEPAGAPAAELGPAGSSS